MNTTIVGPVGSYQCVVCKQVLSETDKPDWAKLTYTVVCLNTYYRSENSNAIRCPNYNRRIQLKIPLSEGVFLD